ncbi:MAG: STAS domain-containing protein [Acidimicrobiales bacterium]
MPLDARIRIDVDNGRVVVAGGLDMATVPLLRAVLAKLCPVAIRHDIVVSLDLSGVTFIDSTGLHLLLEMRRRGTPVRIVATSTTVDRLVEVTQTHESLFDDGSPSGIRDGVWRRAAQGGTTPRSSPSPPEHCSVSATSIADCHRIT